MSALALEIDRTLQQLDASQASQFEARVWALITGVQKRPQAHTAAQKKQQWLDRLERLRQSVGTDKTGTSTEAIIEDIRSERD